MNDLLFYEICDSGIDSLEKIDFSFNHSWNNFENFTQSLIVLMSNQINLKSLFLNSLGGQPSGGDTILDELDRNPKYTLLEELDLGNNLEWTN